MLRFVLGVGMGVGIALFWRSRYATDMQKVSEALLVESRRVLEETRHELQAAAEAGRTSFQQKADRMRTAVEHPDQVEREHGVRPGQ